MTPVAKPHAGQWAAVEDIPGVAGRRLLRTPSIAWQRAVVRGSGARALRRLPLWAATQGRGSREGRRHWLLHTQSLTRLDTQSP